LLYPMDLRFQLNLEPTVFPVEVEVMDRSLSKGLSAAGKKNYPYALILGSKEAEAGLVSLKDMSTGIQETLTFKEALNRIKSSFNVT